MQLKRIALYLGLPAPEPEKSARRPKTAQEALRELAGAGLPVMEGRPDDPMLAFLDLP